MRNILIKKILFALDYFNSFCPLNVVDLESVL
jgi:hypothetical protein